MLSHAQVLQTQHIIFHCSSFALLLSAEGVSFLLCGCSQEQPKEEPASGQAFGNLSCSKKLGSGQAEPTQTSFSHLLPTQEKYVLFQSPIELPFPYVGSNPQHRGNTY